MRKTMKIIAAFALMSASLGALACDKNSQDTAPPEPASVEEPAPVEVVPPVEVAPPVEESTPESPAPVPEAANPEGAGGPMPEGAAAPAPAGEAAPAPAAAPKKPGA